MATAQTNKYKALKNKKSSSTAITDDTTSSSSDTSTMPPPKLKGAAPSRLAAQDIFPTHSRSASTPSTESKSKIEGNPAPAKNYTAFLADLVSAFNSISDSSSSSRSKDTTGPPHPTWTPPVLVTSFEGVDHEIRVDGRQKSKLVKALQTANPEKVNEVIKLLKAMPDPTKHSSAQTSQPSSTGEVRPPVPPKPKAVSDVATVPKKELSRWGTLITPKKVTHSRDSSQNINADCKKQKQRQSQDDSAIEELQDWDKLDTSWWNRWEAQKSNDQETGVPKGAAIAAESPSTSPPAPSPASWWWPSAPSTEPLQAEEVPPPKPPVKDAAALKLSKYKSAPDLKRAASSGFTLSSLFTKSSSDTTTSDTTQPLNDSGSKKKPRQDKEQSNSGNSLSTGEQIARAAASMLAAAAVSKPKNHPAAKAEATKDLKSTEKEKENKSTAKDTSKAEKDMARASATKTIRTTTLKSFLQTQRTPLVNSKAVIDTPTRQANKKSPPVPPKEPTPPAPTVKSAEISNKKSSSTLAKKPVLSLEASHVPPPPPSLVVRSIHALTTGLMSPFALFQQCPPSHMISAYTFWWGYEIYIPHEAMNAIERVSNASVMFFNLLSGALIAIPGLGCLTPISKIIASWVGYQWQAIKSQDVGKGVVVSATWVLPVALASRSWDISDSVEKSLPLSPIPMNCIMHSRLPLLSI